jgi:hypothetical protein
VNQLRLRSFTAVCVEQGHFDWGCSKLHNVYLAAETPELWIQLTEDLFVAECLSQAHDEALDEIPYDAPFNPVSEDHERERFHKLRGENREKFDQRLETTRGIVETLPLGLPTSLQAALLRHDYGLDLHESEVVRLNHRVRQNAVVPEFNPFLEDRRPFLLGARSGLSANTVIERLHHHEYPDTSGAALSNRLQNRSRRKRLQKRFDAERATGSNQNPEANDRALDQETLNYRAITLGGRLTIRASQPTVRQLEVLRAEDEVMLEVAFGLIGSGYSLIGLAGDEFVVECEEGRAEVVSSEVQAISMAATGRILGRDLVAPVTIEITHGW